MIGTKSGELTVVEYSHTKNNTKYWVCQCSCGNTSIQRTADINRQKAKSCGCMRYKYVSESLQKDIVGMRFSRLLVISKSNKQSDNGTYFYNCKCDCGNDKEISGASLRHGLTKSCGCLKIEMNMKRYDNGQSNGTYHNKRLKADNQKEHKIWRKKVCERDNYTCVLCGYTSVGGLCAHHIKEWSLYPELRTDVSNGVTLCRSCHSKVHSLEGKSLLNDIIKI